MIERELTKLLRRYEKAFNTNDAKAMNDLFTDDPVFVNFGGNLVADKSSLYRSQAFVFGRGGPLERIKVGYGVERITVLSPTLAMIHARQHTAPLPEPEAGDPMEAVFLILAERDAAGWRIKVGQNTPVVR